MGVTAANSNAESLIPADSHPCARASLVEDVLFSKDGQGVVMSPTPDRSSGQSKQGGSNKVQLTEDRGSKALHRAQHLEICVIEIH
jgi:hypothetical protein